MNDPAGQGPPSVKDLLVPVTSAARQARSLVTKGCMRWQLPLLIAPAGLVASEFVTNAVVHANTLIDVAIVRGRRHLLILVSDGNPAVPARPRRRVANNVGRYPDLARGLLLVDASADLWGWRRTDGGKTMWAALRIEPA